MDDLNDTPASPVPDWSYANNGAETPEHIISDNENDDAPISPIEENEGSKSPQKIDLEDEDEDEIALKHKSTTRIEDSNEEEANEDEEPPSKKRKAAVIVDSDDENEEKVAVEEKKDDEHVSKIIDDIFGGESDSEGHAENDEHKPKVDSEDDEPVTTSRKAGSSDEDDRPRHKWDFDEMMARKKAERKSTRRRHRDGGIDLISDNDEQIKRLVDQMTRAAALDRASNENRQPAFQKHKLLPIVKQTLLKQDLFEALLDNGMINAVSDWLAPLPDKSLPSLDIRTTLLTILSGFPSLETGILRQSGLGKAVMYLLKHPREVSSNKQRAASLIREWSRPIFQLESDYSSMTREERYELDNMSNKRRRPSEEVSSSRQLQRQSSNEDVLIPGQTGFVSRARVPKASTKAYINRPKSNIEGQFHGPSKARSVTRFDIAQREFKMRNSANKTRRHIGPSINKLE